MGLEAGSTIASLVSSNPTSGDSVSRGDDHLRLIKSVLKATFPGAGGQGFTVPITATEAELNLLHGKTAGNFFAAGTKLLFGQASAPTGWVQDVTDSANNRMLRVVSAANGGNIGGSHSPILMDVVPGHTHTFAASTGDQSANHTHTDSGHTHTKDTYGPQYAGAATGVVGLYPNTSGTSTGVGHANLGTESANHHHDVSGNTNVGSSNTNWTPRYLNLILCTKS